MILPPNSEIDFSPYRFVGRFRFNIAFALVFAIKPRMTLAPNSGSGISPSRFVGRVSFFLHPLPLKISFSLLSSSSAWTRIGSVGHVAIVMSASTATASWVLWP